MPAEIMLLREKEIEPTDKIIKKILEPAIYNIYREIIQIATREFELTPEWRYYNDGKAWLCKVADKKKTIFWLSVFEKHIKTSFFFTTKTREGIYELDIDEDIKKKFRLIKPTGKLYPLALEIDNKKQLSNFRKIAEYRKGLK